VKFGIPSVIAALAGAFLLKIISGSFIIAEYDLGDHHFTIHLIDLLLSVLMIFFALYELIPYFRDLSFQKDKLYLGGLISGFFGGLSGHQGALRSAFLVKYGLSKESFVATGVVVACCVDVSRLLIYGITLSELNPGSNVYLLLIAVSGAFAGAFLGSRLIKKITIGFVQGIVSVFLVIIAALIGSGLLSK
jgi:uncharacterized membrane protein YfcA